MKKTISYLLNIFLLVFCAPLFSQSTGAADSLEKLLSVSKEDTAKVNLLNNLVMEYIYQESDKALKYAGEALELSKKINFKQGEAISNRRIAIYYFYRGDYKNTMDYFQKALSIYELINDTSAIATSYSNIGGVQLSLGNYSSALENLLKSLRIAESIPENSPGFDKGSIAKSYNNIGLVYYNLKNLPLSLEYHQKSLVIKQELKDKLGTAASYQNIGMIYDDQEKDSLALENYNRALKIFRELQVKNGEGQVLINIGSILKQDKEQKYGLDYFNKALNIFEGTGELSGIVAAYIDIADCYFLMEKYEEANTFFLKGQKMVEELGDKEKEILILKGLANVNSKIKNFEKAFGYFQLHSQLKDTLHSNESTRQIAEMQTKYDTEKKDTEIKLLNKDKEIQAGDIKKQKIYIYSVISVLVLVLTLVVFIYRSYKQKQSANFQLEIKNAEIEEKNEEILASIRYAKRIQEAMLKEEEKVSTHLPDHFVLFKPKDIVSGDFYWAMEKKLTVGSGSIQSTTPDYQLPTANSNIWYVAAADCTGHGVPGAFLTMLGMSFLNEITISSKRLLPSEILDELRNRIIKELGHTGKDGESKYGASSGLSDEAKAKSETSVKDGMDISLLSLNLQTLEMDWSGANNSLNIIRNGELKEIKADKQPVGYFPDPKPFTNHKIQLQKGDAVYIFTDGYADQFGGPKGKKFKYSQFEKLLVKIQNETMKDQKGVLNNTIENWKGWPDPDGGIRNFEQIDDICVIGIRI